MSLFDVIRYPVNDIFDYGAVSAIPLPILVDWANNCYHLLGKALPEFVDELEKGSLIMATVSLALTESRLGELTSSEHHIHIAAMFLYILKQGIEEY